MKLHPDIEKAINKQINHEFISAYAYLAMAGWFEHKSLNGFAAWMKKTVNDMIAKLTLAGDNANGLFLLDQQAGERATVKPPA
ncbi:MAG: hypothetical protein K9N23_15430 [Akkermansiaceae bacterium]|nr:hypothetical protein [Akkermansiaceae bacterium]MCF7733080.1 hypothetical protein [Akkermansiaceae bacterium]